jgi:hypothetical protein
MTEAWQGQQFVPWSQSDRKVVMKTVLGNQENYVTKEIMVKPGKMKQLRHLECTNKTINASTYNILNKRDHLKSTGKHGE